MGKDTVVGEIKGSGIGDNLVRETGVLVVCVQYKLVPAVFVSVLLMARVFLRTWFVFEEEKCAGNSTLTHNTGTSLHYTPTTNATTPCTLDYH